MARRTAARGRRPRRVGVESLEGRRLLSSVLTWHNDAARTGLNAAETLLTPANVNSGSFGKLFSYPVDGQVYAQPLYAPGVTIPGRGVHNIIVVATEADSVYALDADSPVGAGGVLWHVNLGTPAPLPNPYIYPPGGRYGPNIAPVVGITGTPVIDPTTNTIYVDAFTNDAVGVFTHRVHALDLATGADKMQPAIVSATTSGNSVGGDGSTVTFNATHQLQRPALSLVNGVVYVSYGSYSDGDPYHGWVLGFDAATLQLRGAFNDTPNLLTPVGSNPGEGAFWQSGAGPSSDGSNLFLMSGNGDFNASLGDYGDSFIKLSTANGALTASDFFTPGNQQQLADQDQDLGSGGPMVLPDSVGSAAHPHLLVGCGKQGLIYLIDRDNLGGFDAKADHVVQEVSLGSGTWSSPAYFNGRVYYHGNGDVLKAFSIQNGVLSTTPVASSTVSYGYPGASPVISANGTANGIVWDLESGGVLHAYDAVTLGELYNSGQAGSRDQLGSYENFTSPAEADGKVFVGTGDSVAVFGLRPAPTAPPAAPSSVKASPLSGQVIVVTWTNNASDVTGFQVQRSTDGTNFTTVATAAPVGLGAPGSYVDTSAAAGQTLYYRVVAMNLFNGGSLSPPSNVATVTVSAPVQVFQDTYSTNTAPNYAESTETSGLRDSWTVSNGRLNYAVASTNGWASSVFLLTPSVASTAGLSRFTVSGDLIAPKTYQAGLVLSGDTTAGGFVVQEFDNGVYNNHLVLLRETGGQLLGDEGGVGNPPVLADFGDISAHNGDTFRITAAVDRGGPHPIFAVSVIDLTTPSFTLAPQAVTDTGDPADYGGTQIGWRARWMAAPATFGVDNLTLSTPPPPADELINGSGGDDVITLKRDGANIDWTVGSGASAQTGQLPAADANGLTINGNGGNDSIVLNDSGGNPLPDLLKLNGAFSTGRVPPLVPGQTIDLASGSLLIHYAGSSSLPRIQAALASGFDGGKWDGTGIISSAARTNVALGVAANDSADPLNGGQPPGTILLHVALRGDANSDGRVDFADLLTLAQHYNQAGADWAMGDFDYSGTVGFPDLLALAQNYGATTNRRRTNPFIGVSAARRR